MTATVRRLRPNADPDLSIGAMTSSMDDNLPIGPGVVLLAVAAVGLVVTVAATSYAVRCVLRWAA